uniref:Radical S-adenosyl methionine domain containing 2 n=1 Tax=Hucho hucho TaxID=62062 RepID=A0A4W5PNX4_9TELE
RSTPFKSVLLISAQGVKYLFPSLKCKSIYNIFHILIISLSVGKRTKSAGDQILFSLTVCVDIYTFRIHWGFKIQTLLVLTGEYLDILAISCDSFDEDTNQTIGRAQGKKSHLDNLFKVREWCRKYKVAFKINSVINTFNVDEDMRENITKLNPVRWKVFQCLLIDGENAGENSLREAERFVISDQQFQDFLDRHSSISCLVPESNQKMRFLDCREGRKDPSKSILDVGVEEAIQFSGFDEKMFLKRGGKYLWSKADMRLEW